MSDVFYLNRNTIFTSNHGGLCSSDSICCRGSEERMSSLYRPRLPLVLGQVSSPSLSLPKNKWEEDQIREWDVKSRYVWRREDTILTILFRYIAKLLGTSSLSLLSLSYSIHIYSPNDLQSLHPSHILYLGIPAVCISTSLLGHLPAYEIALQSDKSSHVRRPRYFNILKSEKFNLSEFEIKEWGKIKGREYYQIFKFILVQIAEELERLYGEKVLSFSFFFSLPFHSILFLSHFMSRWIWRQ